MKKYVVLSVVVSVLIVSAVTGYTMYSYSLLQEQTAREIATIQEEIEEETERKETEETEADTKTEEETEENETDTEEVAEEQAEETADQ